jgi:hypothetical protein
MATCPVCGESGQSGKFCTACGGRLGTAQPPVQPVELGEAPAGAMLVERKKRARAGTAEVHLSLQPSETAVLHAASRIFAAWVAQGNVSDANQPEMEERSVRAALRLAVITDRLMQSDDEDW